MATIGSENEFIHCFVASSYRKPPLDVSAQFCTAFRYTHNQKTFMVYSIHLYSRVESGVLCIETQYIMRVLPTVSFMYLQGFERFMYSFIRRPLSIQTAQI